jgi:hypothetical protein
LTFFVFFVPQVFIFTQSMYASRAFLTTFSIVGAAVVSTGFLYLVHVPVDDLAEVMGGLGQN